MSSPFALFLLSAVVHLAVCFADQVNEHADLDSNVVCQPNSLTWSECQFTTGVAPFNQQKCFAGINTGQNAQGGSCSIPTPANGCILVSDLATLTWSWKSLGVACCNCWQAKNPNPPSSCPQDCQTPKCQSGSPQVVGSEQLVAGKCYHHCSKPYAVGADQVRYCGTGANFEMAGSVDCAKCDPNPTPPPCPQECQTPKCQPGSPQVAGSEQLVAGKCYHHCSIPYAVGADQVRYCGTGVNFQMAGSVDCTKCKTNLLETKARVATWAGRQSSARLRASAGLEGEVTSMLQVSKELGGLTHAEEDEEDVAGQSQEEL